MLGLLLCPLKKIIDRPNFYFTKKRHHQKIMGGNILANQRNFFVSAAKTPAQKTALRK